MSIAPCEVSPTAAFRSSTRRVTAPTRADAGDPGAYVGPYSHGVHRGNKETIGSRSARSFNRDVTAGDASFLKRERRSGSVPARRGVVQPGIRIKFYIDPHTPWRNSTLLPKSCALRHVLTCRSAAISQGPGDYEYGHLYQCGSDQASIRVRSSFQSEMPLGGHIRKSTTPGVGEYETTVGPMGKSMNLPSRSFSKEGHSMFASNTPANKSLADTGRTDAHVSPSSYDLSRYTMKGKLRETTNSRLPGFKSSAPRFEYDEYDD